MQYVDTLYKPNSPSKLGIRGLLLGAETSVSAVSCSALTMMNVFLGFLLRLGFSVLVQVEDLSKEMDDLP